MSPAALSEKNINKSPFPYASQKSDNLRRRHPKHDQKMSQNPAMTRDMVEFYFDYYFGSNLTQLQPQSVTQELSNTTTSLARALAFPRGRRGLSIQQREVNSAGNFLIYRPIRRSRLPNCQKVRIFESYFSP